MGDRISVLIVDDHPLVRHGLRNLLDSQAEDIWVSGVAEDGETALGLCDSLHPSVVLMDIRMPGMNGIEAIQMIHRAHPEIKVIVLTTFDDDVYVFGSLQAGVGGYILKDAPFEEIANAIRRVHAGEAIMSPRVTAKVIHRLSMAPSASGPAEEEKSVEAINREISHLSPREREILGLIGKGLDNRAIADALYLSEKTVRNHISHIYERVGVHDRAQAVIWAIKHGLVE